jgi:hypothetical protein
MLARIASQGFDVLPELFRLVVNATMQMDRERIECSTLPTHAG